MERLSDTAIDIINRLHTERLDYNSEYLPLIDAVQRLAAYENTGLEPWEVGPAIEKAAKDAETATATKMAECIAGGIKDTVEAIHRDPDGFFKGGAR